MVSPFLGDLVSVFFSLGEIIARLIAIINILDKNFVGGYLPVIGSIVLFFSILNSNLYVIISTLVLFGLFTANFISIVIRRVIKVTNEPILLAVSNLTTLGFSGFIFGPATVGYTAIHVGLTFNMYAL